MLILMLQIVEHNNRNMYAANHFVVEKLNKLTNTCDVKDKDKRKDIIASEGDFDCVFGY